MTKEALASPKDAALKLALDTLKRMDGWLVLRNGSGLTSKEKQIVATIEAALAQPAQQEPVAFLVDDDLYYPEEIDWETLQEQGHTVAALYTSPPAQRTWGKPWVSLTDEQKDILNFLFGLRTIDDVWFGDKHPTERGQYWWRNRLRKAFQEAAHGIKE